MKEKRLNLSVLTETLAICRLEKDAALPEWAKSGSFVSATRTPGEFSIVCPQIQVPPEVKKEKGWKCIQVRGPLDFSLTGILASLTTPLARAGISVFAISTYDTDYLLVKEKDLQKAIEILDKKGHRVQRNSSD